jgi:hypothetical protein
MREKPPLTKVHMKKRKIFANEVINDIKTSGKDAVQFFNNWVFSDECSIKLIDPNVGNKRWMRKKDKNLRRFTKAKKQNGGGTIMVWGPSQFTVLDLWCWLREA